VSKEVQLAFNQVVKRIEPLTRLGTDTLKPESDLVRMANGKAFWRFTPRISSNREEHTDRLPRYVTRVDSSSELDDITQQTVRDAYEALPGRIESWLRLNSGTDRKLEPSHCFDGPQIFGSEHKCVPCLAAGWIKCDGCQNGYNDCSDCSNKGHVPCSRCHSFIWGSTGQEDCRGCGASGKKNGNICPTCNGRKKVTCTGCGGVKTVKCKKCKGEGRLPHQMCKATGRLTCQPCQGTGYLHAICTVSCVVEADFRVALADPKSEVVSQLTHRDLDGLRRLASVTQRAPVVSGHVVERQYDVECIITELGLQVGLEKLELIGYGGRADIFDFKRIVPVILDADLAALDQAVSQTSYRLWGHPEELVTTTARFLESEVNVRIDDEMLLSDGIVDAQYVERVKTLLPAALGKIISANLGLSLLVTALLSVAVFLICHFSHLRTEMGGWVFVPPAVAAIISWMLFERRLRGRLGALLFGADRGENEEADEKLERLLGQYYLLWKARGFALLVVTALLMLTALLPLPLL
jgi:hypothetical protein